MQTLQTQGGRSDQAGSRSRRSRRARGDKGAALVEFAIVSLLLFSLLFGIVDFGWAFTKNLDVRHGAREIGRLAVVNFEDTSLVGSTQAQRIVNAGCARMDGSAATSVVLSISGSKVGAKVIQQFHGLTGFFNSVLPSTLQSTVFMKVEQTPTWSAGTYACGAT